MGARLRSVPSNGSASPNAVLQFVHPSHVDPTIKIQLYKRLYWMA